jgi:hypothetical protein
MSKSNGIKSLKQAAKLLNKHAPDGESLAYINPKEARLLKAHGGSGIETLSGVPSYWEWLDTLVDWVGDAPGKIWNAITGRYEDQDAVYSKEYPNKMIERGRSGIGTFVQDAIGIYGALRAKKDAEGLNEAEMAEFNRLQAQLTASQEQFTEYTDAGSQLKAPTNVPTTISDVAQFTETTGRPDMITTAVAQGGRIGAFNGGIQGLMPQQGFMPQPGLDPRMGYALGEEVEQVTEEITETPENMQMADIDDLPDWWLTDFEELLQEFRGDNNGQSPKNLNELEKWYRFKHGKAQGGRIGYAEGLTVAEKTPLYIDPNTDLPLHNIEKEIQHMDREQRLKLYFEMLRKIESYKDIEEMDQGRKFEDLLHWGAMGGDEISGGGSGASEMTEALEFTNHPAAEALYERGEHYNRGGRIGAQGGGIMPLLNMGGMEKDYRQDGGFVPIGRKEKADDVPARLSKNEFVFTADAVRAAGGGDIDQGAQRMYNVMKNLEAGGDISEQSQGKA